LAGPGRPARARLVRSRHGSHRARPGPGGEAGAGKTDFLLYAGRRLERLPTLLIATYRDDEIGTNPALTRMIGEAARFGAVRRLTVGPLTPAGVSTLLAGSGLDAAQVYRQIAGNAFFVSELRAAGTPRPPAMSSLLGPRGYRRPGDGCSTSHPSCACASTPTYWPRSAATTSRA
jgi:hypothetical protein